MISNELANVSDWLLTWAAKGEDMPPAKAAHLAHVLLDLSRQTRLLERLPVDLSAAALFPSELEEEHAF
jgi:hypothetical protein